MAKAKTKEKEAPKQRATPKQDGLVEKDGNVLFNGLQCYIFKGDEMVCLSSIKAAKGKLVFFRKTHHHTFEYIEQ